jgi:Bacterial Ig domain
VANNDIESACNDSPSGYYIFVLDNDSDPDGPRSALRIVSVTQPSVGSTTISSTSTRPYVILWDGYPDTFFGTVHFTYKIVDGHGASDTASVSFKLTAPACP